MKELLAKLLMHETLTREEARAVMLGMASGEYPGEQVVALLTAIQMRGVVVDELLGLRDAMLETGVPVKLEAERFIDVVGTGGDGKNTFNISTASCFVIAGAGYRVAKHGNHAATSVSGASDVLANHGVKFSDDMAVLNRSLNEAGVTYLHAPLFAKAMKHVAPLRRALPFATVFNLLGPLVNPAQPPCQLLGVANLDQLRLYRQVNQSLGIDHAVVNSIDGYDEISLTSSFKVASNTFEKVFQPSDLGFPTATPHELAGGNTAADALAVFDAVLENRALPAQKNAVSANAAMAIFVLERGEKPLDACVAAAQESIESGRALQAFQTFVKINS